MPPILQVRENEDGVIVIEDTPAPESDEEEAEPVTRAISEYTSRSTIKVTVGTSPNKRVHHLHKALLCDKSDYFRACLTQPMIENRTKHVRLREDDPEAFGLFVNWLYTSIMTPNLFLEQYIDVYILADKLMMSTRHLKYSIIQAFQAVIEVGREKATIDHVTTILASGLTDSELMNVAIHKFAANANVARESNTKNMPVAADWMRLLGEDAMITVRVLEELKAQWQAKVVDDLESSDDDDSTNDYEAPAGGGGGSSEARGTKRRAIAAHVAEKRRKRATGGRAWVQCQRHGQGA